MTLKGGILVILGFAVFVVAALLQGYVRKRLQEADIKMPRWTGPVEAIRLGNIYLNLVRRRRLPMWPLVGAVVGLPLGVLLIFYGLIYVG